VKKLKLVADPYPPYQWEEKGIIKGADHEIITRAFRTQSISIETTLHGWIECINLVKTGKADGIFQITITPERERMFLFSDILRIAETCFFRRKTPHVSEENDLDILKKIQKLRIGTLSGYNYDTVIDNLGRDVKIEANSNQELLFGLQQGNFDYILIDTGVAGYLINKFQLKGIEKSSGYIIKRKLHVAFNKKLTEIVKLFNTGLRIIKDEGIYDQILSKYLLF